MMNNNITITIILAVCITLMSCQKEEVWDLKASSTPPNIGALITLHSQSQLDNVALMHNQFFDSLVYNHTRYNTDQGLNIAISDFDTYGFFQTDNTSPSKLTLNRILTLAAENNFSTFRQDSEQQISDILVKYPQFSAIPSFVSFLSRIQSENQISDIQISQLTAQMHQEIAISNLPLTDKNALLIGIYVAKGSCEKYNEVKTNPNHCFYNLANQKASPGAWIAGDLAGALEGAYTGAGIGAIAGPGGAIAGGIIGGVWLGGLSSALTIGVEIYFNHLFSLF